MTLQCATIDKMVTQDHKLEGKCCGHVLIKKKKSWIVRLSSSSNLHLFYTPCLLSCVVCVLFFFKLFFSSFGVYVIIFLLTGSVQYTALLQLVTRSAHTLFQNRCQNNFFFFFLSKFCFLCMCVCFRLTLGN